MDYPGTDVSDAVLYSVIFIFIFIFFRMIWKLMGYVKLPSVRSYWGRVAGGMGSGDGLLMELVCHE